MTDENNFTQPVFLITRKSFDDRSSPVHCSSILHPLLWLTSSVLHFFKLPAIHALQYDGIIGRQLQRTVAMVEFLFHIGQRIAGNAGAFTFGDEFLHTHPGARPVHLVAFCIEEKISRGMRLLCIAREAQHLLPFSISIFKLMTCLLKYWLRYRSRIHFLHPFTGRAPGSVTINEYQLSTFSCGLRGVIKTAVGELNGIVFPGQKGDAAEKQQHHS